MVGRSCFRSKPVLARRPVRVWLLLAPSSLTVATAECSTYLGHSDAVDRRGHGIIVSSSSRCTRDFSPAVTRGLDW
jgi:hypothetical protein